MIPIGTSTKTGVVDLAGERKHLGTFGVGGSNRCKLLGALFDDDRDVRPRFNIVQIRGLFPESGFDRVDVLGPRFTDFAFQRGHQARLIRRRQMHRRRGKSQSRN